MGGSSCPLNFGLSENCPKIFCLSEDVCLKMQNLGLNTPILVEFRSKIEILSTHNFFCLKFAAVCRNSVENW